MGDVSKINNQALTNFVDLFLVAHYGESPSLRPMSTVRSEWPHVPDARKVVLVDAVSGHRATL